MPLRYRDHDIEPLPAELLSDAVELCRVVYPRCLPRLLEHTLRGSAEEDSDLHELVADVGPSLLGLLDQLAGSRR